MGSTDSTTVIIPISVGTAAAFDQNVFPLAYYEDGGNNLSKGSFLIKATLDELEKIKELGIDLLNKNDDFIFNTRLKIEALRVQKAKLQDNRKTLNPFKAFLNYRAARLFHAGSRALYLQTKRTSEKMHREEEHMRVVPSAWMRTINGTAPPDAELTGWAIDLPNGMNDNIQRTINDVKELIAIMDPFQDNTLISQLHDGEKDGVVECDGESLATDAIQIDEQVVTLADTASLLSQDVPDSGVDEGSRSSVASSDLQQSHSTSAQTISQINIYHNSVLAANSNVSGLAFNRSSRSSGASVT